MDKCAQMWTRNYGALGQTARVCFGVLCTNRTREVKRDFGDLPIRRSEGRVVNTPLVFKRVLFEKKEKEQKKGEVGRGGQESPGERTDGRRRRKKSRFREKKGKEQKEKDKRVRERERTEGGGETEKREETERD
ncbi:hypothetical protein TNCV_601561 [Trichonephila clavipes]|nr:hypothetical protein TNCV_601561 [Trichonephila clavipes]